jgi:Fe-S cluster biogenesis protein NfuA/nitrite reductase/ring-hydroxylating ferredoxin subunit
MTQDRSYEELGRDLERLDSIVDGWEGAQRGTVTALVATVESLNREALRRMIAHFKQDPAGVALLKSSLADPWIRNVLVYHGLVRPPPPSLEARVEKALAGVRPQLESHGGDVELVAITSPDSVEIRLLGSCDGCSSSGITLKLGVEEAIREACPEIKTIVALPPKRGSGLVTLSLKAPTVESPFSVGWDDAGPAAAVREGALSSVDLPKASVLLALVGGKIKAYANACPHLGMPLDQGSLEGDVLTCRYHGFRYHLDEGTCLSAPEIALVAYPVQIHEGRVLVQVVHG